MIYIAVELYSKPDELPLRRSTKIEDDDSMRAFCENTLKKYGVDDIDVTGMSLEELITYTLKHGRNQFDEMQGWGLNYVIRGDNITSIDDQD